MNFLFHDENEISIVFERWDKSIKRLWKIHTFFLAHFACKKIVVHSFLLWENPFFV